MIIFLQNAWSPVYAGTAWPRRSWLRALDSSRSGQKVKILTSDLSLVHNVAPICGKTPSSVTPVDRQHVGAIIDMCKPRVIVACGLVAEKTLREAWAGALLCLPHPAHRVLTNDLYKHARKLLDGHFTERLALRQHRKGILLEYL